MSYIKLSLAGLIFACLAIGKVQASPPPDFTCSVPAGTILQRDGYSLGEELHVYGDKLALETYGDPEDQLTLSDSHGAIDYFSKGNIRVAVMPDSAQIELPDGIIIPCEKFTDGSIEEEFVALAQNGAYGKSYGSVVRSVPNLGDNKIDRLPENEPIYLLRNVGNNFDGYDWFEIEYSEGVKGFVWGGTMCSQDQLVIGVANQC